MGGEASVPADGAISPRHHATQWPARAPAQRKAGKVISPFIQKAKDMLLEAGLKEGQITTKLVEGSRSAAADILDEMKSSKAGSLFIGQHGFSNVGDFAMGSVTRKVLNQAEDMAVCVVP